MNKAGMHLQAEHVDHEGLIALGAGICLGMQNNLGELAQIRRERPDSYIILRYYDADTMSATGAQRAQQHFEYLTGPVDGTKVHQLIDLFIPYNEQNLALEHPSDQRLLPHPDGSGGIYSWWETRDGIADRERWTLEYMTAFRALCQSACVAIRLGGPAESPGHDVFAGGASQGPESEYGHQSRSLAGWDVWVAHCYGDPSDEWTGGRWRKTLAKVRQVTGLDKPFVITEFNGGDFVALLRDMRAEPSALGACWFLWAETDPAFQTMAFIRMSEQRQRLKDYLAQQETEPQPQPPLPPPPPVDEKPLAPQEPGFKAGFKELAERLGREVIGDPVENELNLDAAHAFQTTTKGLLWYRAGGQPMFLPAHFPKTIEPAEVAFERGIDVSNWSGRLSAAQIDGLKAQGVTFLIAGTQDRDICRQQLEMARDHGLKTEAYVYLYWDDVVARVRRAVEAVKGLPVARLWLDVEEPKETAAAEQMVKTIKAAADACAEAAMPWGIYTSISKWQEIAGNSEAFAGAPLWDARYDNEPSFDYFQPYGGWQQPACKQYAGDVEVCGVKVDLNVRLKGS